MRAVLHHPDHVDEAPRTVYARLLDEGSYLCSVSTMYRILRSRGEVTERRRQATHPARVKPELVADGPNEVWSWDITRLRGPARWVFYYLYSAIDIFSRYTPGWMIATRESAWLAERFLAETLARHAIAPGTMAIHADRGASMASRPVALLLADLGVRRSFARPRQPNDNPYSEAQFKTLKYRPDFPERFGSIEDARAFCQGFFGWYNHEHRHSGIGFHTPADVHFARAEGIRQRRAGVLLGAYLAHPERFVRTTPQPPELPAVAWINRPDPDQQTKEENQFLNNENEGAPRQRTASSANGPAHNESKLILSQKG